jgi:hypothetical protein
MGASRLLALISFSNSFQSLMAMGGHYSMFVFIL